MLFISWSFGEGGEIWRFFGRHASIRLFCNFGFFLLLKSIVADKDRTGPQREFATDMLPGMKSTPSKHVSQAPGQVVRALRQRLGLTLIEVSHLTGLTASALSKIERGLVSLSYDKLSILSKGLKVDMSELLNPAPVAESAQRQGQGRRTVQRAGEGQIVVTHSYRQSYLGTEILNKLMVPMIAELRVSTLEEFMAEFGDFIRHPGEEFAYVLEGEVDFHSELYAPVRLKAGDCIYFDSEMGHAYLKGVAGPCTVVGACAPREPFSGGTEVAVKGTFERFATDAVASARTHLEPPVSQPTHKRRRKDS